jgi:hypothetical protein
MQLFRIEKDMERSILIVNFRYYFSGASLCGVIEGAGGRFCSNFSEPASDVLRALKNAARLSKFTYETRML